MYPNTKRNEKKEVKYGGRDCLAKECSGGKERNERPKQKRKRVPLPSAAKLERIANNRTSESMLAPKGVRSETDLFS